jgi:CheY-like chemotaxis protein
MKKRVLIVEDESHLQKLVASTLEEAGYEVLTASDGEMGLKIIEDQKPDLVLLDLILPKKDGFDVLEYKTSKEGIKDIPVVILTNLEEKFDIERALAYGVRAYLIKANYRPQEILQKINEILS